MKNGICQYTLKANFSHDLSLLCWPARVDRSFCCSTNEWKAANGTCLWQNVRCNKCRLEMIMPSYLHFAVLCGHFGGFRNEFCANAVQKNSNRQSHSRTQHVARLVFHAPSFSFLCAQRVFDFEFILYILILMRHERYVIRRQRKSPSASASFWRNQQKFSVARVHHSLIRIYVSCIDVASSTHFVRP